MNEFKQELTREDTVTQKIHTEILQALLEIAVTRANDTAKEEDQSVKVGWNKRLKKHGLK